MTVVTVKKWEVVDSGDILRCISVHAKSLQSCPSLCYAMDCSPSGPFIHGIFQARILEWVAMPFSTGSSQPRDWTRISCISSRFFLVWATWEALFLHQFSCSVVSNCLRPHGLQHARLPCPSPTPGACSNSSIKPVMPSNHLILFQPFLLLSSIFSSITVFSNEVSSSHQVAKVLELQLQHPSFQWIFRTDFP